MRIGPIRFLYCSVTHYLTSDPPMIILVVSRYQLSAFNLYTTNTTMRLLKLRLKIYLSYLFEQYFLEFVELIMNAKSEKDLKDRETVLLLTLVPRDLRLTFSLYIVYLVLVI